ncbi:MAG TPA: FtsQ-type POTRA domain-containing protein [Rhizomicrobium sp.]|nr:FtsQ-type POTRA domain-containing protein [Rhizomicrobium sp.]
MRSVKAPKRPSPRVNSGRRGATPARAPRREQFGKREKFNNGRIARFFRETRERLTPSRPMLYISTSLFALALIVGLLVGGYVGRAVGAVNRGMDAIAADAGFGISSVHLAGNRRTPPASILAALGFEPGQSIFGADVHAARARLMQLEWVAAADVSRRYPDSISVSIVEKRPFALWQAADGLHVIERSSKPIAFARAEDYPHLPVFIGDAPQGGAELTTAIARHRAVFARVKAMQRISGRRWNLILDDGVVVKLPEEGWRQQLDALEHLIVDKSVLERDIVEIDLRSPDNYFFVLRSGEQQQVTRGNKT